jgi:hypothetical protein
MITLGKSDMWFSLSVIYLSASTVKVLSYTKHTFNFYFAYISQSTLLKEQVTKCIYGATIPVCLPKFNPSPLTKVTIIDLVTQVA